MNRRTNRKQVRFLAYNCSQRHSMANDLQGVPKTISKFNLTSRVPFGVILCQFSQSEWLGGMINKNQK